MMKIAPLRTITQEEITTYQRDGVVWLREIIEPEWALGMGWAIDAAIDDEHGFVLNLTNFGEEADNQANVDRADDHFHRIIEALKEEVVGHWDDPIYHRGTVLIDEQVGSDAKRGQFLSMHETWYTIPFIRELTHTSPLPEIAVTLMGSKTANLYGDQIIGLRVVADEEDETVGSVEYLRGSHRDGTIYKCSYFISDLAAEQDPGVAVPDIEADKSEYNLWHCRESWLK